MERRSIQDQGGHRLNPRGFRFFQTRLVFTEMDNLNGIFCRVKRIGYVLFGGNAYGASSVVKNGFAAHGCILLSVIR
jgi:hypothetical protein